MNHRKNKPDRIIPTISVSIVLYKTEIPVILKCIKALLASFNHIEKKGQVGGRIDKILLVDNSADHKLPESIDRTKIRYIKTEKNLGYGGGHNIALAAARSDLHLFLNPDAFLDKEFLANACQIFDELQDVALVGARGIDQCGKELSLAKRYPKLFNLVLRGLDIRTLNDIFFKRLEKYKFGDKLACKIFEAEHLSGCCLFGRTELIKRIGGFDESFFLYFEDFDLCRRLSKLGKIVSAKNCRVTHLGGHTARKGPRHIYFFFRSAIIFFKRYGWSF